MMDSENIVTFDEEKHEYRYLGVKVPSVTQILSIMSKEIYGDVPESVLQNKAGKGSEVHKAIETYVKFGIEDATERAEGYFNQFVKFYQDKQVKVIESEKILFNLPMMYAGTADLICEIDGKKLLIDYKTTSDLHNELVIPQLAAYKMACEYGYMNLDGVAVLLLRENDYRFIEYKDDAVKQGEKIFLDCLAIRNYLQNAK